MKTQEEKYDVGIIIGRFQVPELHEGHRDLIQHVTQAHQKTIIFLGTSPLWASTNNPLDFQARRQMIHEFAPDVEVLYVKDTHDDERWSKQLDRQIEDNLTPSQSVILYGARDSFINHYTGRYPTRVLEADKVLSGTAVRNQVKSAATRGSEDFRAGVIWATGARFPTCYPTVDIAILSHDGQRILLGRKEGEKLLRFPGGFADPRSARYEDDAKREALEETGAEISGLMFIGSCIIDDWRYRGEPGCIKTMLFVGDHVAGKIEAGDDIAEIEWVDYRSIKMDQINEAHRPLMAMFREYMGVPNE
jgi:bifunctional NMN adenylyltransferase/nudix hydrolase